MTRKLLLTAQSASRIYTSAHRTPTRILSSSCVATSSSSRPSSSLLSRSRGFSSTTEASASTTSSTSSASASTSTSTSTSSSSASAALAPWTPHTMRTGVIAKKRGMTASWMDEGERVPVTVLQLDNLQVISHSLPPSTQTLSPSNLPFSRPNPTSFSSLASRDLHILQLGSSNLPARKIGRAMMGHFENAGITKGGKVGKRVVKEWRVSEDAVLPVGTSLSAAHFVPGQFVDVTAKSIGKGFQGAMKRHGFHGLKASHGVSLTHRSAGSTGQHQDPGRVLPGKKMAGHMGTTRTTTQNLQVMRVDTILNLIYVKGCVPGFDDADVLVKDAKRKVGWKVKEGIRKGREMGEWLGGGVKGLPTPGGLKENEEEMGVKGGVVDFKVKAATTVKD